MAKKWKKAVIRQKTEVIMARVKKYILMASVKLLSITSTSREKRFVMRPRGVVSKKDIGARRTRVTACRSMVLLAFVPNTESITEKANMRSAWARPRPAYTPIYCPVDKPNLFDVQYASQRLVTMFAA
jgi:hypothetical protein